MKNCNIDILNAVEQSEKMKLSTDFKTTIEIISSYPLVVQYIKLNEITAQLFNRAYSLTKDEEMKENRDAVISESVSNLEIYAYDGNDNLLKPIVNGLKDNLSRIFLR